MRDARVLTPLPTPVPRDALVFYYWRFGLKDDPRQWTRREIVDDVVLPIFADPRVRAEANCIYARKYTTDPQLPSSVLLLEECDEVRLFMASVPDRRQRISTLVANHVAPLFAADPPFDYPAKDRAGRDDCAWYRRCLTEVTGIALDLHHSPFFAEHRRLVYALDSAGGLRALSRLALHDYLLEHSRSYAALGLDGQARFWREFHRWGPAPNLYPPGHLFANLLLVD